MKKMKKKKKLWTFETLKTNILNVGLRAHL